MPTKSFNLTAHINAKLGGSVKTELAALKRRIDGLKGTVKVGIDTKSLSSIKALDKELIKLNATLKTTDTLAKSVASTFAGLAKTTVKVHAPLTKTSASATKAASSLKSTAKAAKIAKNEIEEFGRVSGLAIRRFAGFTIATTIVFGLLRSISSAVGEAISFQRELVRVSQVTKVSTRALSGLTSEITRLSTEFGVASKDLIGVSRILSQTGLSANETKIALEALAKSTLAPTFTDIEKTAEGAIAAMRQFGIGASGLEKALSSINAVAGKFAVESDDIIAAIRRAGGVFSAASSNVTDTQLRLRQFIATFTSVRATTRESAESIATGLRTIFTRIQRGSTIRELERLGISLRDAEGKFVGAFEAINRLSIALQSVDPRSPVFAQIAEELGGFRQVSKTIPLIQQMGVRMRALAEAQKGQLSLTEDAEKAQEAFAVQLARVREEFIALVREISRSDTFKALITGILEVTRQLIRFAEAFKEILPLVTAFAAFKGVSIARSFLSRRGFFAGLKGKEFAGGGLVPGGKGTKDDYPARLVRGEYVIRRKAVDKLGVGYLDAINRGYAKGGLIKEKMVGGALLKPFDVKNTSGSITVTPEEVPSLKASKTYTLVRQSLPSAVADKIEKDLISNSTKAIQSGAKFLGEPSKLKNPEHARNLLKSVGFPAMAGHMFEGMLHIIARKGTFNKAQDAGRPFDFIGGAFKKGRLAKHYPLLSQNRIKYVDAKYSLEAAEPERFRPKIVKQLNLEAGLRKDAQRRGGAKKTQSGIIKDYQRAIFKTASGLSRTFTGKKVSQAELERNPGAYAKLLDRARKSVDDRYIAKGQDIPSFASGGLVDAMLTRGEYVMDRKTVDALGIPFMNRLNKADKMASGGLVGFARGGRRGSRYTDSVFGTEDDFLRYFGIDEDLGLRPRPRPSRPSHILPPRDMGPAPSPPPILPKKRRRPIRTRMPGSRTFGLPGAVPHPLSVTPAAPPIHHFAGFTGGVGGGATTSSVPVASPTSPPTKPNYFLAAKKEVEKLKGDTKVFRSAMRALERTYKELSTTVGKETAAVRGLTAATEAARKAEETRARRTHPLRGGVVGIAGRLGGSHLAGGIGAVGRSIAGSRIGRGVGAVGRFGGRISDAIKPATQGFGTLAFAAPLLASQLDPTGTSRTTQGVSGAAASAGIASALGLGPIGIAAGAGLGALQGLQGAEEAQARAEADQKLKSSSEALQGAFEKLNSQGIGPVLKSFEDYNLALGLAQKAIDEEEQGFLGGVSDNLGRIQGQTKFGTRLRASSLNIFGDREAAQRDLIKQRTTAARTRFQALQQAAAGGADVAERLAATRGEQLDERALIALGLKGTKLSQVGETGIDLSNKQDRETLIRRGKELARQRKAEADAINRQNAAIQANIRAIDTIVTRFETMAAVAKRAAQAGQAFEESMRLIQAGRVGRVGVRDFTAGEENVFANPAAFTRQEFAAASQRLVARTGGPGGAVSQAVQFAQGGKEISDRLESTLNKLATQQQTAGLGGESAELAVEEAIKRDFRGVPREILDVVIDEVKGKITSRQGDTLAGIAARGGFAGVDTKATQAAQKALSEIFKTEIAARRKYTKGIEQEANYQLSVVQRRADIEERNAATQVKLAESFGRVLTIQQKIAPLTAKVRTLTQAGGIAGGTTNPQVILQQIARLRAQQGAVGRAGAAARAGGRDDRQFVQQFANLGIAIESNVKALETLSKDTTKLAAIQAEIAAVEKRRDEANKTLLDLMQGGFKDRAKFQQQLNVLGQFLQRGGQGLSPQLQAQAVQTAQQLGPLAKFLNPKANVTRNLGNIQAQATAPFFAQLLNLPQAGLDARGRITPQERATRQFAQRAAQRLRTPEGRKAYQEGRFARNQLGRDPNEAILRYDLRARGYQPGFGVAGQIASGLGQNAAVGLQQQAIQQGQGQRELARALLQVKDLPGVLTKLNDTLNRMNAALGVANAPAGARGQPVPAGLGPQPNQRAMNIDMEGKHNVEVHILGGEQLQAGVKELVMHEVNKAIRQHVNPVDGSTNEVPFRQIA